MWTLHHMCCEPTQPPSLQFFLLCHYYADKICPERHAKYCQSTADGVFCHDETDRQTHEVKTVPATLSQLIINWINLLPTAWWLTTHRNSASPQLLFSFMFLHDLLHNLNIKHRKLYYWPGRWDQSTVTNTVWLFIQSVTIISMTHPPHLLFGICFRPTKKVKLIETLTYPHYYFMLIWCLCGFTFMSSCKPTYFFMYSLIVWLICLLSVEHQLPSRNDFKVSWTKAN